MDPNQTLAELLAIANGLYDADTDNMDVKGLREIAEQGCMLAEYVKNLDEWLTKGGFLPSRWASTDEPQ
jgi:hypothetical protein